MGSVVIRNRGKTARVRGVAKGMTQWWIWARGALEGSRLTERPCRNLNPLWTLIPPSMRGRGVTNHPSLEFRGTKFMRYPQANLVVIPGSLCEKPNANPVEDHPRDILGWQVWLHNKTKQHTRNNPYWKCHMAVTFDNLWNLTITEKNSSQSIFLWQIPAFSVNVTCDIIPRSPFVSMKDISRLPWNLQNANLVRGKRKMDYGLWHNCG